MDRPPDPGRTRVRIAYDGRDSARGLGLLCALVGLFLINGISIEFPGIILGALGYYFCLQSGAQEGSRAGQILAIVAVVPSVISIVVSGLIGPPQ